MGPKYHLTLDTEGLANVDDLKKSIKGGDPLGAGHPKGFRFDPSRVDLSEIVILDLFKANLPPARIAKVVEKPIDEVVDKLVSWRLVK